MRKFFITLASAVCLVSLSSGAVNAQGLYVSGFLGANTLHDAGLGSGVDLNFDVGGTFSGAIGYAVTPNVRVEGELAHRFNDIDELCLGSFCIPAGDSMSATSLMANAFYDFDTGGSWRPYLGGGIGATVITLDTASGIDDDDTVFAAQLGAGVGFQATPSLVISFDYRFFFTDDPEFSTLGFGAEYMSHTLAVGLRFHF